MIAHILQRLIGPASQGSLQTIAQENSAFGAEDFAGLLTDHHAPSDTPARDSDATAVPQGQDIRPEGLTAPLAMPVEVPNLAFFHAVPLAAGSFDHAQPMSADDALAGQVGAATHVDRANDTATFADVATIDVVDLAHRGTKGATALGDGATTFVALDPFADGQTRKKSDEPAAQAQVLPTVFATKPATPPMIAAPFQQSGHAIIQTEAETFVAPTEPSAVPAAPNQQNRQISASIEGAVVHPAAPIAAAVPHKAGETHNVAQTLRTQDQPSSARQTPRSGQAFAMSPPLAAILQPLAQMPSAMQVAGQDPYAGKRAEEVAILAPARAPALHADLAAPVLRHAALFGPAQTALATAWLSRAEIDTAMADMVGIDDGQALHGSHVLGAPPTPTPILSAPQLGAGQPSAASLSAQLLPFAQQALSGPVELVLSPAELGELRFEIHQRGDQVQIVLTAERPETVDLLRRNGEQLVQDFKNAGFSGASLSFGQWGSGQHRAQTTVPDTSMLDEPSQLLAPPLVPFTPPRVLHDSARSLNLRL